MTEAREALAWIAKEAGEYGDGAPDAHYLARLLIEIESRAKTALASLSEPGWRELLLRVMDQAEADMQSAHAVICELQGRDPSASDWPEWSPQANSRRWFAAIRAASPKPASPAPAGVTSNAVFDAAWEAILECADLKAARRRLSVHELRQIIRCVAAAIASPPAEAPEPCKTCGDVKKADDITRTLRSVADNGCHWSWAAVKAADLIDDLRGQVNNLAARLSTGRASGGE